MNQDALLLDAINNKQFLLTRTQFVIGTEQSSDIVLTESWLPEIRVCIKRTPEAYLVFADINDRRQIFAPSWAAINGQPLEKPEVLRDGDCLKVGVNLFWFVTGVPE